MSNPTGIRYNEAKMNLVKEKENLKTVQSVVSFLLDKYWWEHKINGNPILERRKESEEIKVPKQPIVEEINEVQKDLNYNDCLDEISSLSSLDKCQALSIKIQNSKLAAWQKVQLEKMLVLRSQHPDLN